MNARGMLAGYKQIENAKEANNKATLYASRNKTKITKVKQEINTKSINILQNKDTKIQGVPNVIGLSAREAIAILENVGKDVNIQGTGYVCEQKLSQDENVINLRLRN